MSEPKPKALTWRLSEIPSGYTREQILGFFVPEDRDRIQVLSLCPDVEMDEFNVATLLFQPPSDRPEEKPRLDPFHAQNVAVEKKFDDFTPLYHPPDDTTIIADIIAVTGLAGHAFGSWAHADNKMWLRDYLPTVAPSARIMTYGYNNPISGDSTSCSTIEDLSETFLINLIAMRDTGKCEQRPIIFVGHSLGGLIIKKAMTDAWSRNIDRSRLPVRSIIFLGVPHNGMDTEALQILVGDTPPEVLLRELRPGSLTLRNLNKEFKKIAIDMSICTLWESLTTKTVVLDSSSKQWSRSGPGIIMVPEHSTRLDLPRERVTPADADHSSIAKVKRSQKTIWRILSTTIQAGLAATRDTLTEKPQQQQHLSGGFVGSPDWAASPSTGYLSSESAIAGSSSPPETHTDQHKSNLIMESPDHQFKSSHLPLRPALATTVPGLSLSPGNVSDQRSQSPPLPGTSRSQCSLDSTLVCDGSLPQRGSIASAQSMTPTGEASSTIDSSLVSVTGDDTVRNQEGDACNCNPDKPGDAKLNIYCRKCSRAIYPLDPVWRCFACKYNERVCAACHSSLSKDANCVMHPDMKAEERVLIVRGKQLRNAKEDTISTEDSLANQALKRNDIPAIKRWFSRAKVMAKTSKTGQGPLHIAAELHLADAVEALLHCEGVQINAQDNYGYTPLATAIMYSSGCIVQKLLKNGADVYRHVDNNGNTPLHIASYWGFAHIVHRLTDEYSKRGSTTIDEFNNAGQTALFDACDRQHWEVARILLRAGADPLAQATNDDLPKESGRKSQGNQIGLLAALGHIEAVNLLLSVCGNLSVECPDSQSRTLLFRAAVHGRETLCESLLKLGADPNAVASDPPYPVLYAAASAGQKNSVKALLNDDRTQLEASDSHGATALLAAAHIAKEAEIVKMLLERGANANPEPASMAPADGVSEIASNSMRTPLYVGASRGQTDICRHLLDHGTTPDVQSTILLDGEKLVCTPLYAAAGFGYLAICKMLIEAGAGIDCLNQKLATGYTPLHAAAAYGHEEIVSYLLLQGAAARPPSYCNGRWKHFSFEDAMPSKQKTILRLLRAHKHS